MISDTERREVATRLRKNASQDMDWMVPWAVFNDAEQHASESVVRRLADLVEPSCDRDALLALADEMDDEAEHMNSLEYNYDFLMGYSRRIREALGVEP